MIYKVVIFSFFVFGLVVCGSGQSTRDVSAPRPPSARYQSTKKEKKAFFLFKVFKKKDRQLTGEEEIAEFRKRIANTTRKKAKMEKKASKPQYADPLYFGHKKPPKKRPNGKKKFCKECGLTH
ncbi:MAG: hypothetical protein RIC30_02090 [Marinoscillum sp.]|uniref:hypothetical protein n=1 Tax=Marinoscillum sp. TaxID=2024838 RepID=UPI0033008048